jgi:uncharacterized HAD superfamily protein
MNPRAGPPQEPAPTFYVDVDDVLADTTRQIAALAARRFDSRVRFEELTAFDLGVSLGLPSAQLADLLEAIHDPGFLEALPVLEGADGALRGWAARGRHITVVTGRPPWTRGATRRWLERRQIPFHALEVVDKYGRYAQAQESVPLERLAQLRIELAVEDSLEMADYLVRAGVGPVFLMDRPWNRDEQRLEAGVRARIRRVHHWSEVVAAGLG